MHKRDVEVVRSSEGSRGRLIAAVILIAIGVFFLGAESGLLSWSLIGDFFGGLGNLIGNVFGALGDGIGAFFGGLGNLIGNLWPLLLILLGAFMLWRGYRPARK